jgi:hypothetical protein
VVWIVFDGLGFEHARRCADPRFPSIDRISREGHLGPSMPSSPACQTPTALYTLFTGTEPTEHGIWGYLMPDPRAPSRIISGFHAAPRAGRTVWRELQERGTPFSVLNVAFRNDPVWRDDAGRLALGCDDYRLWRKASHFRVGRGRTRIAFQGIGLEVEPTRDGARLAKGARLLAELADGGEAVVRVTRGLSAYAFLLGGRHLVLCPFTTPMLRGSTVPPRAALPFADLDVFGLARRLDDRGPEADRVDVETVMRPALRSMLRKDAVLLDAMRDERARLVIGYFPLIDEYNHAFMDRLEADGTGGGARPVFESCMRAVDGLLQRVMAAMDGDTLLVVSSDHGAAPTRGVLHLNELLAEAGLVRRGPGGYDLRRSAAWYHPSDCGLVALGAGARRAEALPRLARALEAARDCHGVDVRMLELDAEPGYPAFLYPGSDAFISGRPPRRGSHGPLDKRGRGGHHLSPLAPTPWIQAVLGLWSPRGGAGSLSGIPAKNSGMKDFILGLIQ